MGLEMPMIGYKKFIDRPTNIRVKTLNPTDNTTVSEDSNLSNLSICRINNPGNKVRKRKPVICLKKERSKSMDKFVKMRNIIINKKCLFTLKAFGDPIILFIVTDIFRTPFFHQVVYVSR